MGGRENDRKNSGEIERKGEGFGIVEEEYSSPLCQSRAFFILDCVCCLMGDPSELSEYFRDDALIVEKIVCEIGRKMFDFC